ncbi:hypothetical protein A2U01_0037662, partial [Trifolium medium]|nr:hypothetical protein [Trifolium medium]
MLHEDVQPVALLEVMQCDTSLGESSDILGEESLIPPNTCANIQENSVTVEFDTKNVDFSRKQPLSIAKKLSVEPLLKPRNMQR